jgi:predicted ribosome quality control (RQC) complex YloA/Tae2 family protein
VLSLHELERAAAILDRAIRGHRVQAIAQPDAHSVVLEVYGGRGREGGARESASAGAPTPPSRRRVLLSCHPASARVSLASKAKSAPGGPPRFAQYLRAHLKNARVEGVRLVEDDRQLALALTTREGRFDLLLAIFGRRSNLVVLDADGRIAATLRPLAETRSELELGGPWRSPASTAPRAGDDRFEDAEGEAFLEAIESHYAATERDDAADELRRRLEQALRKERKAVNRKLAKLADELARAEADLGLERQGELLKGVLANVSRGDASVAARDHETGDEVVIALDPAKSPSENLERLFKRYRKAVRTLTKVGAQQEGVRTSSDALAALESALHDAADDAEALAALAGREDVERLLAKYARGQPPRRSQQSQQRELVVAGRSVPARLAPRRYSTESGLEVWVGRSDAANDYLTTRLARGRDLFFHLDGAPGSHVILRTEGRDDPPSEAVLDAAELAVHFSRAKKANRADVHIVPIRNVRKPKGAKPGLVMVHGGKSIHLRRSETRLARILGARVDR